MSELDAVVELVKSLIDYTVRNVISWINIKDSMLLGNTNNKSILNIEAFKNYTESNIAVSDFGRSYFIALPNTYVYVIFETNNKFWKLYSSNKKNNNFNYLPLENTQLMQRLINAITYSDKSGGINDALQDLNEDMKLQGK